MSVDKQAIRNWAYQDVFGMDAEAAKEWIRQAQKINLELLFEVERLTEMNSVYAGKAAGVAIAEAKYAKVQGELESWKATAEELASKNVNKALAQRHEMREAQLKAKYAKLLAFAMSFRRNLPLFRQQMREYSLALEILDVESEDALAELEKPCS